MPELPLRSDGAAPSIDVLGLGAVAIDELLIVDAYPVAESKVRVRRRERQCGGQTGTALVAAARFGARAAYGGLLGDDALSQEVVENFVHEGIETRWASTAADARPAYSTIVVDQTTNTRTVFAAVEGRLGAAPDGPEAPVIQTATVLLIDHHGLEGNLRAARIAREHGRAVVADFERDPGPPFNELLPLVDHLIVSASFAEQLTGSADPVVAASRLRSTERTLAAVTCGRRGCFFVTGGASSDVRHQPAFHVEAVDTTGCGDVLHGVYAASLAAGCDPAESIRQASAAAALSATAIGGQAGIPRRDAITRLLRRSN